MNSRPPDHADEPEDPTEPSEESLAQIVERGRRAAEPAEDRAVIHLPAPGSPKLLPWAIWGGLALAALIVIAGVVSISRPTSRVEIPTVMPTGTWVPVGSALPVFVTDYGITRGAFDQGDYTPLGDLRLGPAQPEMFSPGTQHYTARLSEGNSIFLSSGWCAKTESILKENMAHYAFSIVVNGNEIPRDQFFYLPHEVPAGANPDGPEGWACSLYGLFATDWPHGQNHVVHTYTLTQRLNDGYATYEAGSYVMDYTLLVDP